MGKTVSTKERNDGTKLEELIEFIERSYHPSDFTVKKRWHLKDKNDGEILAELDILIEGKVGKCPYKLLIECRDRPSGGPQGREWLYGIKSRKEDFGCHNVIAVSSTGFSSPAQKYAIDHDIQLRTFSEIDSANEWLPKFFPFLYHEVELKCVITAPKPTDEQRRTFKPEITEELKKAVGTICDLTGNEVHTEKLWQAFQHYRQRQINFNRAINSTVPTSIICDADDFLNDYRYHQDGHVFLIGRFTFVAEVKTEQILLPLRKAGKYLNEDGEGDTIFSWSLDRPDMQLSAMVIQDSNARGPHIVNRGEPKESP